MVPDFRHIAVCILPNEFTFVEVNGGDRRVRGFIDWYRISNLRNRERGVSGSIDGRVHNSTALLLRKPSCNPDDLKNVFTLNIEDSSIWVSGGASPICPPYVTRDHE